MSALAAAARLKRDDGLCWIGSALLVLALHVGGILFLRSWQTPLTPAEPAPPAIMIDLAPLPTPPAPTPSMPAPAAPAPPETVLPEAPPEPPIVDVPPPPPAVAPEVALPPVTPKPKPLERKQVEHKRIERRPPPKTRPDPTPPTTAAAPPSPAPAPAAPTPPTASPSAARDAMPRFESLLLAHLEREKRYPRTAQLRREQGTVLLRFTMERDGRVRAATIERGSGYAALDQEVLELIRRAQPLPPLPPEIAGSELELVVPVRFSLR